VSEKTTILQCSGQKNNGSRCTREKEFPVEETPEEWRCWQHFKDDIKIDCCKELTDKQKRFVEEYLGLRKTERVEPVDFAEDNSVFNYYREMMEKPRGVKF